MLFIGGGSGGLGVTNYVATAFHLKTGVWLMFHFTDNFKTTPDIFQKCSDSVSIFV